jgi:hypothetical protein
VAIAVLLPLGAVLAWLVRPGFMGPMFANPAAVHGVPVEVILGAAGILVGEFWIHRILSGVGKQDDPTWRYRDR